MKGESSAVRTIFRVWENGVEGGRREGKKSQQSKQTPGNQHLRASPRPGLSPARLDQLFLPVTPVTARACPAGSPELCSSAPHSHLLWSSLPTHLRLDVQDGNLALLVNLVHSLELGAKHVALVAAKLQELIGRDAPRHLLRGDEVIFLAIFFTLPGWPCRICTPRTLINP